MSAAPINVARNGTVMLGPQLTCDGFLRVARSRVQTHIHLDHMDEFQTSKGYQQIYMTKQTRALLINDFNADIPYRENIHPLEANAATDIDGDLVTLAPSGHMLGCSQVAVTLSDGQRVGYSGDFQWPNDPIQVDAIVVDSTYGSPDSLREFSQEYAEARFLELLSLKLKQGHVNLQAHRGTVQRALQCISTSIPHPLIATTRLCGELAVYRSYGYGIKDVLQAGSPEARDALASGPCILAYSTGDGHPVQHLGTCTMILSAYMGQRTDPVLEYTENACQVSLSNHADFIGTLEYVEATGAKYVVTDNTRGGHALELASEIRGRLGIDAMASSGVWSKEWGA